MKYFLGLEEVANITGMTKQNVQIHIRSNTFPTPAMFVGTRSGWAIEQIEDYAKRSNRVLNQEKVQELVKASNTTIRGIPPFYYLGFTEVGNLLGWNPAKVKVYSERGALPKPVASIGKRVAWSVNQIVKFAKENEIELQDVPNKNLAVRIVDIKDHETWTVYATYTGKWMTVKESLDKKPIPRTHKGIQTTSMFTIKDAYEMEVYEDRSQAVNQLLTDAIEQNYEWGVNPDFDKELLDLGGIVQIAYRFGQYKVLPVDKAKRLLEEAIQADLAHIAQSCLVSQEEHGVCAFDLAKGSLLGYGATYEGVYPPLQPVIVLYWVDKDTNELHDLTSTIEEQLNELY